MATRATWTLLAIAATAGCSDDDTGGAAVSQDEPPGRISIEPASIDVGDLALHEESSTDLTITNTGEGPLLVYDVQMANDSQRAHWTLQGGKSGELAPGDSTRLVVIANPGAIVNLGTRLEILSDDPNSPSSFVPLAGTTHGVADARLSPESLDIGTAAVGHTIEGDITIANDGSAGLEITALALSSGAGGWEILVNPQGTTVAPQSEDGLVVIGFRPTAPGISTNSLLINTSDPDAGTIEVPLVGTGT